jgi:hypothetical protein
MDKKDNNDTDSLKENIKKKIKEKLKQEILQIMSLLRILNPHIFPEEFLALISL